MAHDDLPSADDGKLRRLPPPQDRNALAPQTGYGGISGRSNERVKAKIEAATITGPLTEEVVQRILTVRRQARATVG